MVSPTVSMESTNSNFRYPVLCHSSSVSSMSPCLRQTTGLMGHHVQETPSKRAFKPRVQLGPSALTGPHDPAPAMHHAQMNSGRTTEIPVAAFLLVPRQLSLRDGSFPPPPLYLLSIRSSSSLPLSNMCQQSERPQAPICGSQPAARNCIVPHSSAK